MSRRSAMEDWIGSDSPAKPQHLKIAPDRRGSFPFLTPMSPGDYLARNVKWARARLLEGFQPQRCGSVVCVGPEHDH